MRYIPALDAIRGFAILWVLVYHYYSLVPKPVYMDGLWLFNRFAAFGFFGVSLFFCLSGFLIGGILMRERGRPSYFSRFFIRRAFRLLPVLLLLIGAYLILGKHFHGDEVGDVVPVWSHAVFLQNFYMAEANAYGNTWLGVTWSLAVEEQFYILAALALFFCPPRYLRHLLIAGVFLPIVFRYTWLAVYPHLNLAPTVLLPMRMDAFCLGMLLAQIHRERPEWIESAQARRCGSWLCLLGLATVVFIQGIARGWIPESMVQQFVWINANTLMNLSFTGIILLALTPPSESKLSVRSLLESSWLRSLGKISYFVYLAHMPVLILVSHYVFGRFIPVMVPEGILSILVSTAIVIAAGALSMRYFEGPLINLGRRLTARSTAVEVPMAPAAEETARS